jgi:hypothetical protein
LEGEGIPSRKTMWHRATIYRILRRAGYKDPDGRSRKSGPSKRQRDAALAPAVRDKGLAAWRAAQLRAQGLTLRKIGAQLRAEGYCPPRSDIWHAASVLDLLRLVPTPPTTVLPPA